MDVDWELERFPRCLVLAQREDPRAFDELVRWLDRPLLGFLHARGAHDPEGTANEVLVRMFQKIEHFDGTAVQFRAWVFRIARNLLIDEHRRSRRRPDARPTAPEDLPEDVVASCAHDRLGEIERIDAMLAGLTDDQREVLLLRVVAGLSVDEVAGVVGRQPGAVRALQHRALVTLRSRLASTA